MAMETATLGGGCFWCLEAVYLEAAGVVSVESGYMGGHLPNPSYEDVCTGRTGHVEVTQIRYDTDVTSFGEILDIFFAIHDPTTRDRQGNDVGPQYRSVIFYHGDAQLAKARETIDRLEEEGVYPARIVTELQPASVFYKAEGYHQDYFRKNPNQPYCQFAVAPKVAKFRQKFTSKLKSGAGG